jgi:hypothetical protein
MQRIIGGLDCNRRHYLLMVACYRLDSNNGEQYYCPPYNNNDLYSNRHHRRLHWYCN